MCFDDGTGDNPVPRPYPGNASTDSVVEQSYVDYWRARTGNPALTYADLRCNPQHDVTRDDTYDTTPFQGAIGEHGIHFFMTGDTDNAGQQQQIDELDGQQWRFAVPTSGPRNVIQPYALVVLTPLQPAVTPFDVGGGSSAANAVADPGGVHPPVAVDVSGSAAAALLPLLPTGVLARRRRTTR